LYVQLFRKGRQEHLKFKARHGKVRESLSQNQNKQTNKTSKTPKIATTNGNGFGGNSNHYMVLVRM
jgi:hypothetical protein